MNHPDGHRIIETVKHDDVKIVECTRWEEIKECVNYHADLSGLLGAPTVFKVRGWIGFVLCVCVCVCVFCVNTGLFCVGVSHHGLKKHDICLCVCVGVCGCV